MYWYNPKSRTSERVAAPTSDMQAICMACTHSGFCRVCKEYCELRRSGHRSSKR
jgi:hypothetical protein